MTKAKKKEFIYRGQSKIIDSGFSVETSPNNRARCKVCGKLIVKGSLRLINMGKFPFSFKKGTERMKGESYFHYYYCYSCYKKQLDTAILILRKAKNDYKRWIKSKKGQKSIKKFEDVNTALRVAEEL